MNSKEFDSFVRSIIFYSLVGPHPHSLMPLHAARYCACVRASPQALFTLSWGMSFHSRGAPPPRLGSRLPPLVDALARGALLRLRAGMAAGAFYSLVGNVFSLGWDPTPTPRLQAAPPR